MVSRFLHEKGIRIPCVAVVRSRQISAGIAIVDELKEDSSRFNPVRLPEVISQEMEVVTDNC